MKKYLKLETLRNNWVGREAVSLNYYSTDLGSELDWQYTGVECKSGVELGVFNTEELDIVETVEVTYASMYGNTDRRLHTEEIEAVIDSTGVIWADAELFETVL